MTLSADLLKGAKAISDYLGPGFTPKQVYHLVEKSALPIVRLGGSNVIYARKSELERHFSASSTAASQADAA